MQKWLKKHINLIILSIVVVSNLTNYILHHFYKASWLLSLYTYVVVALIYAISQLNWNLKSSWAEFLLILIFAMELIGLFFGFNLSTKLFPEILIIIGGIGLTFQISKIKK